MAASTFTLAINAPNPSEAPVPHNLISTFDV
jgi:hypothetical protein